MKINKTKFITSINSIIIVALMQLPALSRAAGGEAGGGGNSINGRLIESYVVEIEQIDGYEVVMAPLLKHLSTELPNFAELLHTTISHMTWYIVPASLKSRSEKITGLPFPSDQVAVQGNEEVFIDKVMFKGLRKFGNQEQGRLLLHEIIMASIQYSCSQELFGCLKGSEAQKVISTVTRKTVNVLLHNPNADRATLIKGLRRAGWSI